ncbi:MAG TPA: hypothetical protein PKA27_02760 [Fimbriimonadaceae bacterium]|nr:hypothetical protein [Fimbriimonadaceae bacterium]
MTRGRRAALGAIFGALIVLALHPASRHLYLPAARAWGPSPALSTSKWTNAGLLPRRVRSLSDASAWLSDACERLVTKRQRSPEEIQTFIEIATRAAASDPTNAFWLQVHAVILNASGDRDSALALWRLAARKAMWNDYQSRRFETAAEEAEKAHGNQSWIRAALYPRRSTAAVRLIEAYSRQVLQNASLTDPQGLKIRYDTLANGELIRDGSRHIGIAELGEAIIEAASHPPSMVSTPTPKGLLLSRLEFINSLREHGLQVEAENANQALLENEAWQAMTNREDPKSTFSNFARIAVASSVLPISFLVSSIFGLCLWCLGTFLHRIESARQVCRPPWSVILGVSFATLAYSVTGLWIAALTTALAFGLLAIGPPKKRSRPDGELGPLYRFMLLVITLAMITFIAGFVVGASTPGFYVLESIDVPKEYRDGSTLYLGLVGVCLVFSLLLAPAWALVHRIETSQVLAKTFRELGISLAVIGLVLSVIAGPAAVFADLSVREPLSQILTNESLYYLK